jgi:oligopeptide/dipeptide ABC transporter ATP-binding protein
MADTVLEIKELRKYFPIKTGLLKRTTGYVKAVDRLSFSVSKGETIGIVGESGCGKSTAGRTIMHLHEPTEGDVIYKGKSIKGLSSSELKGFRKEMQMVFQDPYSSLNPRFKVKTLLERPMNVHNMYSPKERDQRIAELLEKCGLDASSRNKYPHEFSGGQRQRIGIARALTMEPSVLILDEPVSALDVSIQSQIINLLEDLQEELGLTYLFISHDLSVVRHISDRVLVMYLGQMCELADTDTLFESPQHPYTQALLSAIPVPDPTMKRNRIVLQGDIPNPADPPNGCPFHTRCPLAKDICRETKPEWKATSENHFVACHLV